MTLPTTSNRERYSGNGTTTIFAYGFKINAAANLKVQVADSDDEATTLVLDTHYTVSGVGEESGGDVTVGDLTAICGAAELPADWSITILREVDLKQLTDLKNQGGFFSETHEDVFDYITMICQQLQETLDRCAQVSETSGLTGEDFLAVIEASEAAAAASEAAAAASEAAAGLSETAAQTAQADAETAQGLAEDAQADAEAAQGLAEAAQADAETAQGLAEDAQAAAEAAQLAAELAAGDATVSVTGTYAAPTSILAGTGVEIGGYVHEMIFIEGTGGVDVTADPQIEAGTSVGQKLILYGTSDSNTVTLQDGDGLSLNGNILITDKKILTLIWDGNLWTELSRN